MTDRYLGAGDDLLAPASYAAVVTPSDSTDLPTASKRLWVGSAGDVTLVTVAGVTVTYGSVPAGTYLQVRAARVKATGTTTAANTIIAEY